MKSIFTVIFAALFFVRGIHAHDPATDMASAANRFLESLDEKEKKKAFFSFDSEERENWHFFPGSFVQPNGRQGLSLKEMSASQKILAQEFLVKKIGLRNRHPLNSYGYRLDLGASVANLSTGTPGVQGKEAPR